MSVFLNLNGLLEHVERAELAQLAGIGSHNAPEGRTLDEDKIGAAIGFAEEMARGYLQKRYPIVAELTPDTTPPVLRGYVADIARYRLRHRSGNRNTTSDEVTARFKDARDWLREVSRGLVNLDLSSVDGGADANAASDVNPGGKIRAEFEPTRAETILDGYLP